MKKAFKILLVIILIIARFLLITSIFLNLSHHYAEEALLKDLNDNFWNKFTFTYVSATSDKFYAFAIADDSDLNNIKALSDYIDELIVTEKSPYLNKNTSVKIYIECFNELANDITLLNTWTSNSVTLPSSDYSVDHIILNNFKGDLEHLRCFKDYEDIKTDNIIDLDKDCDFSMFGNLRYFEIALLDLYYTPKTELEEIKEKIRQSLPDKCEFVTYN